MYAVKTYAVAVHKLAAAVALIGRTIGDRPTRQALTFQRHTQ